MIRVLVLVLWSLSVASCGAGETGDIVVVLDANAPARDGIPAGQGRGEVHDGWSVHFDKFIVVVGDVHIARNESDATRSDPTLHVVDVTKILANGVELAHFEGVEAARWHDVAYSTPPISSETIRDESVTETDFSDMNAMGWSHLIEGMITKPDGLSCAPEQECRPAETIGFSFGMTASASFSFCANDFGVTGIAVPAGGTARAGLSLHGDHMFLNAFVTGHNNLELLAQWLADSDLDGDNFVTEEELAEAPASAVMPTPPEGPYNFAGSPQPVVTAHDFVVGQLATLGHFQGEGECVWILKTCSGDKDHAPGSGICDSN